MKRSLIVILSMVIIVSGCAFNKTEDNTKPEEKVNETIEKQENERKIDIEALNKQLIKAAENRDTESIKNLIKDGAEINTKDSEGRTPTMIATYNNDIQSASVLINAGADVNIQDNIKNNPFLYAGAEGYIEILRLTIKAGADPTLTNRYGGTALIPASEHGYVDVNIKDKNGVSPLEHARRKGFDEIKDILLKAGAK